MIFYKYSLLTQIYLPETLLVFVSLRLLTFKIFYFHAGKATQSEYETEEATGESQGAARKSGGEGTFFTRERLRILASSICYFNALS